MEVDLKLLRCGECGNKDHELYIRPNGEIIAQCIKCLSQSEIKVTEPKIIISNVSGNGTLCKSY